MKVEKIEPRWYMVTNQGGQQKRVSDAQLLLLPMGRPLMISEIEKKEKLERELITRLAKTGASSLTPTVLYP